MGSGRGNYYRQKRVVTLEQVPVIDIRYLKKEGALWSGYKGRLSWSSGANLIGSIDYHIHDGHLELTNIPFSKVIRQCIEFGYTACNYGGWRKWLVCPACNKRVVALYAYRGAFLCRTCHKLPYQSGNETGWGRVMIKKHKLGHKIFDSYERGYGIGKRKGMHWIKFAALYDEYQKLGDK